MGNVSRETRENEAILRGQLALCLADIEKSDPSYERNPPTIELNAQYRYRNARVIAAWVFANLLGYPAGVAIDPANPERPVVYITLPTGQVSWHIDPYPNPYDGHTTNMKYQRCHAYAAEWSTSETT